MGITPGNTLLMYGLIMKLFKSHLSAAHDSTTNFCSALSREVRNAPFLQRVVMQHSSVLQQAGHRPMGSLSVILCCSCPAVNSVLPQWIFYICSLKSLFHNIDLHFTCDDYFSLCWLHGKSSILSVGKLFLGTVFTCCRGQALEAIKYIS